MANISNSSLKVASALALMTLASCLDHADVLPTDVRPSPAASSSSSHPSAASQSSASRLTLASIGLRGAVYARELITHPPVLAESEFVPSWGPDESVETASIVSSLARPAIPYRGRIKVEVGFGPGDGQTALQDALHKALAARAPADTSLDMEVHGSISISTTLTHETEVTLEWRVTRPDGSLIGSVTQTSATSPARVAAHWGDFAEDAAASAAEGILALLRA